MFDPSGVGMTTLKLDRGPGECCFTWDCLEELSPGPGLGPGDGEPPIGEAEFGYPLLISNIPPLGYTESVSEEDGRGLILVCAICGLDWSRVESP